MSVVSSDESTEGTAGRPASLMPTRFVKTAMERICGHNWFLLWLIPLVGSILLWQIVPILMVAGLSFTNYSMGSFRKTEWVGLHNYELGFRDPIFKAALKNCLFYTLVGVPVKNLLGLFVAQLLYSVKRGKTFFRTAAFLPFVMPPLATVILFKYFYHNQHGLFNQILLWMDLGRVSWLTDPVWVKPSLILMIVWNLMGGPMIVLLAGLGTIPEDLREAARIDGANSWQTFWRITWPLMRRPLAFVFITDVIFWMQLFDQPLVLTNGGPAYSSLTAVMEIRRVGVSLFKGGAASALAFIVFLIIMVIAFVQLRYFRTEWEY